MRLINRDDYITFLNLSFCKSIDDDLLIDYDLFILDRLSGFYDGRWGQRQNSVQEYKSLNKTLKLV